MSHLDLCYASPYAATLTSFSLSLWFQVMVLCFVVLIGNWSPLSYNSSSLSGADYSIDYNYNTPSELLFLSMP